MKSFRGSPNYRRFFNNEVHNFLISGRSAAPGPSSGNFDSVFRASVISQHGDLTYIESTRKNRLAGLKREAARLKAEDEGEEAPIAKVKEEEEQAAPGNGASTAPIIVEGTYWSAHEKEIFFSLLSRYSIHQVEAIVAQLPYKSTVEVLNYYHVLKKELRRLKARYRGSPSHVHKCRVRMNQNQQPFVRTYKIQKPYTALVSMRDIPIAYEMSERFIKMEEIQAKLMVEKEMKILNDHHGRFMRQLDAYDPDAGTLMIRRKGKISGRGSLLVEDGGSSEAPAAAAPVAAAARPARYNSVKSPLELENADPEGLGASSESSLINVDNCHRITQRMYRAFYGPASSKKFIKVHYPPLVLLEQIVKLRTRSLVLQLLQRSANKQWIRGVDATEFTHADVLAAAGADHSKAYYYSGTRDKHKRVYARRGKRWRCSSADQRGRGSGAGPESESEISESELDSQAQGESEESDDSEESSPPPNIIIEDIDDPKYQPTPPQGGGGGGGGGGANTPLHISQLPQNLRTIEAPLETSLNKLITDTLHEKETDFLDRQDRTESKNYEHILLTALSTYRENEPEVESTMYDIDAAFELLDADSFGGEESDEEAAGAAGSDTVGGAEASVEISDSMINDFMHLFPNYVA